MTLADLANYICGMVNQTEPADLAACKLFLQQRFKMIWADQLWKDSLFEYTQTLVTPGYTLSSTWLPTSKVLLLPSTIDAVVGVRTDTRKLNVESSERLYRMDFDNFNNAGSVTMYRILSPAVWELDSGQAQNLQIAAKAGADVAVPVNVDTLSGDGVTATRAALVLPAPPLGAVIPNVQRLDGINKPATNGVVIVTAGATTIVILANTDLGAPKRQRVQMLGTMPEGAIARVLGKASAPLFTSDNDVPGLTGCENVLIAFGQADMLKRSRQYGKSAAVQQEGMLLLEQLKRVQVVQQANHKRLMPEDGYGWEYATNFTSPLQF